MDRVINLYSIIGHYLKLLLHYIYGSTINLVYVRVYFHFVEIRIACHRRIKYRSGCVQSYIMIN